MNNNSQEYQPIRQDDQFDEDSVSFIDILLVIIKNFKWVILTPTLTCIIAIIYVLFIAEPVYMATAKILPTGGSTASSQLGGLAAQFGVTVPGSENAGITAIVVYPEIIKSRLVARAVLQRTFDTQRYGPQKTLLQILTYGNTEPVEDMDTLVQTATLSLHDMIYVFSERRATVITLSVTAFEPQLAADITTAVIEELDLHQQQFLTARIKEKKQFIEERIETVEDELEAAEETLRDFRDQNRQFSSAALLLTQERLIREVEVVAGIFLTLKQQYELTKIKEVEETAMVYVLDPPEAPLKKSKPKRKMIVILAGFFGIGLGLGFVFIKDYFEHSTVKYEKEMSMLKSTTVKEAAKWLPFVRNRIT